MTFEFRLPDVGEGIHEGEIVAWKVKEGEAVKENQPLVDVMTDKATVEITSPKTGRIARIAAKEGQVVKVGEVLVVIEETGGQAAPPPKGAGAPAKPEAKEEKKEKTLFDLPEGVAVQYQPKAAARHAAAPVPTRPAGPVLASPATRRLARELGVDLATIRGSGPAGRIERADVEGAARGGRPAAAPAAAPPTAVPAGPHEERVPLRGLRRRIAEHMAESKRHAPHFAYVEEVDVTELVKLREHAKEIAEHKGVKLTYLPFVVKAVTHALKKHPLVNASLDETRNEIVLKKYYNIGIAVETPEGLLVASVKNADKLHILDIAKEIDRMGAAGKEGKIQLADVQGSTFTITSLGKMGGLFAVPIINYPEVGIMGVHKIEKRPRVGADGHSVVVRDMMNISFSFDHRVVDGAVGAEFAHTVMRYLEHPNLLLLEGL